jgi:hypothetical protein
MDLEKLEGIHIHLRYPGAREASAGCETSETQICIFSFQLSYIFITLIT